MTLLKKQESIRDYDSLRRTTCCNCPVGCGLKVFIKDHSITDIYGDEEHPINKGSLCPKGLLSYYHLRNPRRIVHPQIRDSLKDSFRVVSWDEALLFTARKLHDLSEKRGKDSIFLYGDERAPFDYLAGGSLFAKYFGTPNSFSSFFPYPFGREGHIQKMFGIPGSQLLMNSQRDWCNSRCILLYKSDLAASDPITFGSIVDARDRGANLLVIDSKKTITASKATFSVRVRPGSQAVALKGILHLLIQKGLVEEDFLVESTNDFARLKSKVEPFTPRRVSEYCWLKEEDLGKMADLIGRVKPVQVMAGDWITRRHLSDEDLLMCGAMVCLRGSIGIPGGGLNLLNVSPFSHEDLIPVDRYSLQENAPGTTTVLLEEVLLSTRKNVDALFWCGNPCARLADGKRTKAALRNIPLIVHLSAYPNESYHYSHVSLPVSSWLEYGGLIANNNSRAIQWHHKVIDPPGECKSPLDFWSDLSRSLDLEQYFPWKAKGGIVDGHEAVNFFLKQNPFTRGASVERLDPERNPPGGLLWPCIKDTDLEFEESRFVKGNIRGPNILFRRGQYYPHTTKRFPTPTGKISFSFLSRNEDAEIKNTGDPRPQQGSARSNIPGQDMRFPLILTAGVLVDFVEEFGYFASDRDEWTKSEILQVHPQLARILGIKSGEMITLENERGSFTAPAWLSDDVDPRVVWCPEGVDPYQPHLSCESPYTLFEMPRSETRRKPFTMVTIYKQGGDKAKSLEQIVNFVKKIKSGD
jgi:anaerobic selenocysteine-containing dehydrogenase